MSKESRKDVKPEKASVGKYIPAIVTVTDCRTGILFGIDALVYSGWGLGFAFVIFILPVDAADAARCSGDFLVSHVMSADGVSPLSSAGSLIDTGGSVV